MESMLIIVAVALVVAVITLAVVTLRLARTNRDQAGQTFELLADLLSDTVSQNLMLKDPGAELDRLRAKGAGERAMQEVSRRTEPDPDDMDGALANLNPGGGPLIEPPTRPNRQGG